ncbi:MAG: hydrolase [Desulfomonilaceae bacterium]
MLGLGNTFLVLIDVQEKLTAAMYNAADLAENVVRFVKGLQALDTPILYTEQNPQGLGPTIPALRDVLGGQSPVTKLSFSCCGNEAFLEQLRSLERRQALVCGIECHVCVYQTVADLVDMGYEVQVVSDCVSSRTLYNKEIGLQRCREVGAALTSVETALFELLKKAEGPAFKKILALVK